MVGGLPRPFGLVAAGLELPALSSGSCVTVVFIECELDNVKAPPVDLCPQLGSGRRPSASRYRRTHLGRRQVVCGRAPSVFVASVQTLGGFVRDASRGVRSTWIGSGAGRLLVDPVVARLGVLSTGRHGSSTRVAVSLRMWRGGSISSECEGSAVPNELEEAAERPSAMLASRRTNMRCRSSRQPANAHHNHISCEPSF
jgi:hypothetical protein